MEPTPLQQFVKATGTGCALALGAVGLSVACIATNPQSAILKLGLRIAAAVATLYTAFIITRAGMALWLADEARANANVGLGGVLVVALAVLLYVVLT